MAHAVQVEKLTVGVDERVTIPFRNDKVIRVTEHMHEALQKLRRFLISAAREGRTVTYGQAAQAIDQAYLPQGMGPLLDVLSVECQRRGEPSLAALVVTKDRHEVGDAFVGDPVAGRSDCYRYWKQR